MWITVGRQSTFQRREIYWLTIKRSAIHYPGYLISPIWNGKMMTWNKMRNIKVPILIVLSMICKNIYFEVKLSWVIFIIARKPIFRGYIYYKGSVASMIKLCIKCHDMSQKYRQSLKETESSKLEKNLRTTFKIIGFAATNMSKFTCVLTKELEYMPNDHISNKSTQ